MKKKLVLCYPNQRWFKDDIITTWNLDPRTLCLLGGMAKRDANVDVKVIDAQKYNLSREDFKNEIKKYKPDFVGISVLTSEYGEILNIAAKLVKEVSQDIITFGGGVHVTVMKEQAMCEYVDYGCMGEGEHLVPDLLNYLQGKGDFPKTGLVYRENGEYIIQEKAVVEDLEDIPWPDYSLVNMHDYVNSLPRRGSNRPPELPGIHLTVSRGCPYNCNFCQVDHIFGRKIRMRKPEDIVEELLFLKKEYKIKSFVFQDDNLFSMKKKAKHLLRLMIKEKLNLRYSVSGFALFVMDDEMLDLMKESGCESVNIAIESGNERVLKEIVNKPIKDLRAVPSLIQKIKERDMLVMANFIIGLPGEKWSEIQDTIRYAEHCGADYVKFFAALPLIGTKMYEDAVKMGCIESLDGKDSPVIDWRYSQITSDEWTPKDISCLRVYEWDRINFAPHKMKNICKIWGMSEEEIKKMSQETRDALKF
jgi:radical SAM superfamily enzyme YgiQ (UPF0313 family)